MKISTLIVLFTVVLAGCKKDRLSISPASEQKMSDVAYGSDPAQKMDIYLPSARSEKTPFVVILHGGSWVSGSKEEMRLIQSSLLLKGIASANINYRYASATNHFEGMMSDIASALSFVRKQSVEWQVRNKGIVILGASAGAHLGLLYSYAYQQPGEVAAVISLSGPVIFSSQYLAYVGTSSLKQAVEYMVGASVTSNLDARFSAASPANRIANVPTLIIHGTSDMLVPYEQAVLFQSLLQQRGVPNKLFTLEGAGHDLAGASDADLLKIMDDVGEWVNTYSGVVNTYFPIK